MLTGKELAICRMTGAKWVTRDEDPLGLVCIYISEERPPLGTKGNYGGTGKLGILDARAFPSLERGARVKVPAMAPAPEGHEGPEEDRCPVCGAEIKYDGDQEIVDDGTVVGFTCPKCGAYGKAGYNLVFDDYYDIHEGPRNW